MINFPPKKILIAYDPSDASKTAWRHAAALAASCGASLEAVFVVPWPSAAIDLVPQPGMLAAEVRALRAKIRKVVGERLKITILQGDPAARILSLARERHSDLIVVGTHGRKGLARVLLGSTAEAVVRGASVPVLVARGRARPVRRVLAPVNFAKYSESGFAYAAGAAAALKARLTALHVTDDPVWSGNVRARLNNLIQRLPPEVRKSCRPEAAAAVGDVVKGIARAARVHDWIVLVAHERALIKDAFFGTTAAQVLRQTHRTVLAVPAPRRPLVSLQAGARSRARERSLVLK